MSAEMLPIRSVKHYFNEFIVEGLKDKKNISEVDIIDIKAKILRAFQQELYGQLVFKYGPEVSEMSPDDLADMDGVKNMLEQIFRKWRRLCILCTEKGLGNYFHLEDLQEMLKDGPNSNITVPDLEEDVTDKLDEILPEGEEPVYLEQEQTTENDSEGNNDGGGTETEETGHDAAEEM